MDALKKFLQRKKTDKVFKSAGPGHKLTVEDGKPQSSGGSSSRSAGHGQYANKPAGQGQSSNQQRAKPQQVGSGANTEEKRAAAAAALARIEKNKKPEADADKLRASRQMAFIREQARKELESEKNQKDVLSKSVPGRHEYEAASASARIIDPEAYAVSGVYFSCPLIGPEISTKSEIEDNIKEFLLDQPEEELGVTSCLLIYSCNKPYEKITTCVETLCKYLDNIISNPEDHKFRKIRCSNKVFQEKVVSTVGAEQFLRAAGFRKALMKADTAGNQEEEFWVFHPEDESSLIANLIELRDTLKQTTPIRPELDRNVQVLMPVQVQMRRELPDEFYALSLEEIKREQQAKTDMVEQQQILRTKAMRERDELREQRLYRYGIMRIRFPDGFTLQGTFKAHEKLSNLYTFVRENLVSTNITFQLVRSGGETLSESTGKDQTLAELRLPPSSILNFKVDSAPAPLISGELSYLKAETLALVQSLE